MASYPDALAAMKAGKLVRLADSDAALGAFVAGAFVAPIERRLVVRDTMRGRVMRLIEYGNSYWAGAEYDPSAAEQSSTDWEIVA